MSILPVPAKTYFDDFSFALLEYAVERSSFALATYNGLPNKDEDGKYISFLYGCDLSVGDILTNMNSSYVIKRIEYDTYMGSPELTKAYY